MDRGMPHEIKDVSSLDLLACFETVKGTVIGEQFNPRFKNMYGSVLDSARLCKGGAVVIGVNNPVTNRFHEIGRGIIPKDWKTLEFKSEIKSSADTVISTVTFFGSAAGRKLTRVSFSFATQHEKNATAVILDVPWVIEYNQPESKKRRIKDNANEFADSVIRKIRKMSEEYNDLVDKSEDGIVGDFDFYERLVESTHY